MEINPDGCTFCKKEPTELPVKHTACKAFGAYGLEWLMFCEGCKDKLERYDEFLSEWTRSWSKHCESADDHYFTKQQLADAKDMSEFKCNQCGTQATKDDQWLLDSPDDKDFFFLCEICAPKRSRRKKEDIEYFIEDNSD
jgi:hypothetical protein